MDQYTRRIIGFGIQADVVDGMALCRMFKQAVRGASLSKYLTSDHDPLYRFHQREANLRILGVTEIKTVPYIPWSHPFVERLIGTIRRECLDQLLFWTATDLEVKLIAFRDYYNRHRTHAGSEGTNADRHAGVQRRQSQELSLATTLSWSLPNTNRGLSRNSPWTPAIEHPKRSLSILFLDDFFHIAAH
jgi:hypothetical protein